MFVFDEVTLRFPLLPLAVNVAFVGYVNVPLVADKVSVPAALFTFTVVLYFVFYNLPCLLVLLL